MKKTRRLMSALCALALVVVNYTPARADYWGGTLRRDQPLTIYVTNSTTVPAAVTVSYVDARGVDSIEFQTVPVSLNFDPPIISNKMLEIIGGSVRL